MSLDLTAPTVIDCQYFQEKFAAAFLVKSVRGERSCFIENNTARSVPLLVKALKQSALALTNVDFLMVTHVHLDHAGGTSKLLKMCPNAQVLAHPRAAPHLIDPAKLVKSAQQVYGTKAFAELYGQIEPIPAARVRVMQDSEQLEWQGRTFTFLHTRGHANHHFCVHDSASDGVFTGDTFGLAYPALQSRGLFIFPSSSPTDFDPLLARQSIQRILEMKPKRLYLTHFGEVTQLKEAADQLFSHLEYSEKLLELAQKSSYSDQELDRYCETKIREFFAQKLELQGIGSDFVWKWVDTDLKLNAAGIAHVARKRRHA